MTAVDPTWSDELASSRTDMSHDPLDRDTQLATRAAWLYYVEGQTQEQVAQHLGINRIRVNRILGMARDTGLIQVRINTPLASCVALEAALRKRFGILHAVVVPSSIDPQNVGRLISAASGAYVSERLRENMTVGVGWGKTLRNSLSFMARRPIEGLQVVSMVGGLTRGSVMNSYETALRIADLYNAECFYIAGPAFTESEATCNLLKAQSMMQDVFEGAQRADLAFISAGGLDMNCTMARLGMIGPEDVDSLRAAGAVGDVLGHWIGENGEAVDHSLNRRVLAPPLEHLFAIPEVIAAAGGPGREVPIRAALRRGFVDTLITDETTAAAIVALEDQTRL